MKKLFFPLIAGLVLSCVQLSVHAQEYTEHISKEFSLPKGAANSVLSIYNVFGPIKVEGYAGDKVIIEIDETISARTKEEMETGKKEFKMGFDQFGDTIMAFIAEPYDSRPHRNWNNWDDHRRIEYKYYLSFKVKVPFGMNLNVSTVNEGEVYVQDVTGTLSLHNVNGGITAKNAKGTTTAHTVNGPITINYLSNPPEACSYYTVNGKVTVTYQANLSADLEFKSMNGQFYTDFPEVEVLPTKVTKTVNKKGDGLQYKINKASDFRVGAGGKLYKFETLNGNIYIQKQS